jgi:hypothetical protein
MWLIEGGVVEIPKGLTSDQLAHLIGEYVEKNYHTKKAERAGDDDFLACRVCDTEIEVVRGIASVCFGRHGKQAKDMMPCVGGGDAEIFAIPYCPTCQEKPVQTATCIHLLPMDPNKPAWEFGQRE